MPESAQSQGREGGPGARLRHLLSLLLAVVLVGCGGGGGTDGGGASPTEDVPGPTGDGEAPEDGGDAATGTPVTIENFAFDSATLTISAGDTVTWTNNDTAPHTATGDDDSFDSGSLAQGDSFSHTFDEAGTFPYICTFHPTMSGEIVVE